TLSPPCARRRVEIFKKLFTGVGGAGTGSKLYILMDSGHRLVAAKRVVPFSGIAAPEIPTVAPPPIDQILPRTIDLVCWNVCASKILTRPLIHCPPLVKCRDCKTLRPLAEKVTPVEVP